MADLRFSKFIQHPVVDLNVTLPRVILWLLLGFLGSWGVVLLLTGYRWLAGANFVVCVVPAALLYALHELRLPANPRNFLDGRGPAAMIVAATLGRKTGIYRTEDFKTWMDTNLLCTEGRTFTGLTYHSNPNDNHDWWTHRELKVITSDLSTQQMRVLPDELLSAYNEDPDTFSIAEAARQSMSIPVFFESATQPHLGKDDKSTVVDGGVLSNFPVWIFDIERQREAPAGAKPKCPTIGFQLEEKQSKKAEAVVLGWLPNLIAKMLTAAIDNASRVPQMYPNFFDRRVITIPIEGVSTTDFELTNDQKSRMYTAGYEHAKKFLAEFKFSTGRVRRDFASMR